MHAVFEDDNVLAFRRKGYEGEPEYIFFVNMEVDGKGFFAKNDILSPLPKSREHLDIMLKAVRSICSDGAKKTPGKTSK